MTFLEVLKKFESQTFRSRSWFWIFESFCLKVLNRFWFQWLQSWPRLLKLCAATPFRVMNYNFGVAKQTGKTNWLDKSDKKVFLTLKVN